MWLAVASKARARSEHRVIGVTGSGAHHRFDPHAAGVGSRPSMLAFDRPAQSTGEVTR
jgi:hypothetical protein